MNSPTPRRLVEDVALCLGFFTRLPMPARTIARGFAEALWAAPLTGMVVGLLVGLAFAALLGLGLPPGAAAGLALAAGLLATGALHEDGLADVADGFGGGRDRDAKLAIMRDSRIGTYGVAALVLSLLLRWTALASIAALSAPALVGVCIAAHAASRALLPAFLAFVPPARADGLGAGASSVSPSTAAVSLLIGAGALLVFGRSFAVSVLLLALLFLALAQLCRSQIGGQTGDVLGALQQAAETSVLLAATIPLGHLP